jgi:preprotein translocase subunit SecA
MVLDRLLRAGEGKILRKLQGLTDQVNILEEDFASLTDAELREQTEEFKERYADGETLDDLLPEAFAAVREASKRTLGKRHFDVQIMGGAALHLGNIAEMKTGEGKTLVSTLPAYLNALSGAGVHVVTVNDYLAQRDAENMGRIHRFLGLTVGVIHPQMDASQRGPQYACDITYGTNNEFGFDYLRDNMAWSLADTVQRGHHFAILDEVDSILIDEARTPLIISGPAEQATKWYVEFARIIPLLERGELESGEGDYEADEGKRTVAVSERGIEKVEDQLGIDNLYDPVNTPLVGYLSNALKAQELYKKDKDYIVVDGEVLIVDEFTGRTLHGRRYSEGMHQAIEAKERVPIKDENQTLATVTLQNFFRLYDKLAGMTGTAMTEAAEFEQIYKLGVVQIPTNREMVREDLADVIYKTEVAKFEAVAEDIAERHETGQPVLVGTTSVEKSEYIAGLLLKRGIRHEVLNAKQHDREAAIIAQAGRHGAVTVSTNMAGRGTDIMLGGNPDFMAEIELHSKGLNPLEDNEAYEAAWSGALAAAEQAVAAEHEQVTAAGGLYVLGTERHESRRIDNQLRGRAGRQGDPGASRFYLSLGDDLMRLFNASAVEAIMDRLNIPEDIPIESKMVTRAIRSAQTQVESQHFEARKNVLKYDEVMNEQRKVIYAERHKVLAGEDLGDQVRLMIDDVVTSYVDAATLEGFPEEWDLAALWKQLAAVWPVSVDVGQYDVDREAVTTDRLKADLNADAHAAYDAREEALGEEVLRDLERRVLLSVLDRKWREHLYEMDYLQEGIHLRAYGQKDPVVEYQREGFDMFGGMLEGIKEEAVAYLFNLEVTAEVGELVNGAAVPAGTVVSGVEVVAELEPGVVLDIVDEPAAALDEGSAVADIALSPPGAAPTAPVSPALAQPHLASEPSSPSGPRVLLPEGLGAPQRPTHLEYTAPSETGDAVHLGDQAAAAAVAEGGGARQQLGNAGQAIGTGTPRNAPCPCGSGKKYKKCHGAPGATHP